MQTTRFHFSMRHTELDTKKRGGGCKLENVTFCCWFLDKIHNTDPDKGGTFILNYDFRIVSSYLLVVVSKFVSIICLVANRIEPKLGQINPKNNLLLVC